MFNHILVPIDFAESSQRAIDTALELATKLEARVSLLHVYQTVAPYSYDEPMPWPVEQIVDAAQRSLDSAVAKAQQRYPRVTGVLKQGIASDEIVAAAAQSGVSLIVMGTHGRRGLPRFMIGSVAERVVRTSLVPVMTVCGNDKVASRQPLIAEA